MADIWNKRFEMIRFLGWIALAGLVPGIAAFFVSGMAYDVLLVIFVGLVVPLCLYLYVVMIWHWKGRYRGRHSDLWGALILIEASGWFKLVTCFGT